MPYRASELSWRRAVVAAAGRSAMLAAGLRAAIRLRHRLAIRTGATPRLRRVYVEATNRCNLRCPMCPSHVGERERGLMDPETMRLLAGQIPPGSLLEFSFLSLGEPLLHPGLPSMIRMARGLADELFLSTNGVALGGSAERADELAASGLTHVHFSAEASDAESYERIRAGARFDDFLANLRLFRQARDRLRPGLKLDLSYTLVEPHGPDSLVDA